MRPRWIFFRQPFWAIPDSDRGSGGASVLGSTASLRETAGPVPMADTLTGKKRAAESTAAPFNVSTWERWDQRDRDDYEEMNKLGIQDVFRSPDEEFKSKRSKGEKVIMRKNRREHNKGAIEAARARAAANAARRAAAEDMREAHAQREAKRQEDQQVEQESPQMLSRPVCM